MIIYNMQVCVQDEAWDDNDEMNETLRGLQRGKQQMILYQHGRTAFMVNLKLDRTRLDVLADTLQISQRIIHRDPLP